MKGKQATSAAARRDWATLEHRAATAEAKVERLERELAALGESHREFVTQAQANHARLTRERDEASGPVVSQQREEMRALGAVVESLQEEVAERQVLGEDLAVAFYRMVRPDCSWAEAQAWGYRLNTGVKPEDAKPADLGADRGVFRDASFAAAEAIHRARAPWDFKDAGEAEPRWDRVGLFLRSMEGGEDAWEAIGKGTSADAAKRRALRGAQTTARNVYRDAKRATS